MVVEPSAKLCHECCFGGLSFPRDGGTGVAPGPARRSPVTRNIGRRPRSAAKVTAQATPPPEESPVIKARVLDTGQALTF